MKLWGETRFGSSSSIKGIWNAADCRSCWGTEGGDRKDALDNIIVEFGRDVLLLISFDGVDDREVFTPIFEEEKLEFRGTMCVGVDSVGAVVGVAPNFFVGYSKER